MDATTSTVTFGAVMQAIGQFFGIMGGLGVFVFGMKIMSDGLQKAAGSKMQSLLDRMTGSRASSILTGMATTSIMQSSSATTVMVVSVVNAGLLSLSAAIGVIMGANIGTTLTAWIVAALGFQVSISTFALPAIALAFPFLLSSKIKNKGFAEAAVGFGVLFLGLGFLKDNLSTPQMSQMIESAIMAVHVDSYILRFPIFVLIGTAMTILVQSSTAAMTMTLAMLAVGALSFEQAAMIVLGENIGTTITAYLASIGGNLNSKRASRVHIMFNVIGVLWMYPAFYGFLWLVKFIIPDGAVLFGNPETSLYQLSLFHTFFNVVNTSILVWFTPQLEKASIHLVRKGGSEESSLRMLRHGFQEVSDALLFEARKYLKKMSDRVHIMLDRVLQMLEGKENDILVQLQYQEEDEEVVDKLEDDLSVFLHEVSTKELSPTHHLEVANMIRVVTELERMGDECLTVLTFWKKLGKKNLELLPDMRRGLKTYLDFLHELLTLAVELEVDKKKEKEKDFSQVHVIEAKMAQLRKGIQKAARSRLKQGGNIRLEMFYLDIVNALGTLANHMLEMVHYSKDEELRLHA